MMDCAIKNGTIVTHTGKVQGNIAIKDGKIFAITMAGEEIKAVKEIDATGKYIIPGVIDAHVHFQDPGLTYREDFESATCAGAVGGITTAISHPMNIPPIIDTESYLFTMQAYENRGYIDYGIHGGGTATNCEFVEELWTHTGATAIKMFMCFSVTEFPFVRDDALYDILLKLAKIDGLAMIHAENNELILLLEEKLKKEGRTDPMAYHASHGEVGELEAVKRIIYYLEATNARGVILHTGMVSALEEIRSAQERGVKVYAECCPHFLTFIDTDMLEYGPFLKFSPVMRGEKNKKQLWKMLEEGYINTIGSDHSPYTKEEKLAGMTDIWKAPNGIPGIQTLLPVLLDGVSQGLLSMERLVEVTSYQPAHIYGLDHCKGSIRVGLDADLVLIDMDKEHTFDKSDIQSKAKWSPYERKTFKGWPILTMVRGQVVAQNGKVIGNKGYGKYIARHK